MAKVVESTKTPGLYIHYCPGCKRKHTIPIIDSATRTNPDGKRYTWRFTGTVDNPTFAPSVNYVGQCHYTITNGKIIFEKDCTHELAGQTIDMVDWDS